MALDVRHCLRTIKDKVEWYVKSEFSVPGERAANEVLDFVCGRSTRINDRQGAEVSALYNNGD